MELCPTPVVGRFRSHSGLWPGSMAVGVHASASSKGGVRVCQARLVVQALPTRTRAPEDVEMMIVDRVSISLIILGKEPTNAG